MRGQGMGGGTRRGCGGGGGRRGRLGLGGGRGRWARFAPPPLGVVRPDAAPTPVSTDRARPQPSIAAVDPTACTGCGTCAAVCPTGAIHVADKATVDPGLCKGCGKCVRACPNQAITLVRPS